MYRKIITNNVKQKHQKIFSFGRHFFSSGDKNSNIIKSVAKPLVTAEQLKSFAAEVPFNAGNIHDDLQVDSVTYGSVSLRLVIQESSSVGRPGGTISGPVMFALADLTAWGVVLSITGVESRMAVTTSMSIDFLRKPQPVDIVAKGTLLKHGKSLVVSHILLYSDDGDGIFDSSPVATATATYSMIPPKIKNV